MADSGVGAYYDRLTRWNRAARMIGYGGGSHALTVHRRLADPRAHGDATSTRLHDLLIDELSALKDPRVLDAGCGLGGTMIALAQRLGGTYCGVTLSSTQASVARRAVKEAGLGDRIRLLVQSYDDPPPGPYDVVLAIESLAHSANPEISVAALIRVLAPGGRLAIVDDMPEAGSSHSADLEAFKAGWNCGALWGHQQYLAAFASHGLRLVVDRDLSADCRPRPGCRIDWLSRVNRVLHRTVPHHGMRAIMDAHYGGLALERLLRSGLIRYRLLIGQAGS